MKKIFIDGGAHNGESIDNFRRLYPDNKEYEIHSFEPNEDKWSLLEKKDTILHKCGLWSSDGEKKFYKGRFSTGSTFLEKKVSGKVDYNHPFPTKVIRLSKWIEDTFDKDDYIVLKLDIEGSEYEVIPDLISTKVDNYINEWYGELHSVGENGRIRSYDSSVRNNLINLLREHKIVFKDWHDNRNML